MGVIGTGFGARVVAPVFAATPGCDVVDVVSARDVDAVERLCRRDDVDLVSVHSPPFRHAPDVRLALASGHHVLCDKPFAMDAVEAAALLKDALAAGVVHAVNFEFRHDPARLQLHRLVADGGVGVPQQFAWTHASNVWRRRASGWQFDRALGGGWIGAWGSHAIDFLRWTFGALTDAGARTQVTIAERPDGDGNPFECTAEDAFTAWMRTADGATERRRIVAVKVRHCRNLVVVRRDQEGFSRQHGNLSQEACVPDMKFLSCFAGAWPTANVGN